MDNKELGKYLEKLYLENNSVMFYETLITNNLTRSAAVKLIISIDEKKYTKELLSKEINNFFNVGKRIYDKSKILNNTLDTYLNICNDDNLKIVISNSVKYFVNEGVTPMELKLFLNSKKNNLTEEEYDKSINLLIGYIINEEQHLLKSAPNKNYYINETLLDIIKNKDKITDEEIFNIFESINCTDNKVIKSIKFMDKYEVYTEEDKEYINDIYIKFKDYKKRNHPKLEFVKKMDIIIENKDKLDPFKVLEIMDNKIVTTSFIAEIDTIYKLGLINEEEKTKYQIEFISIYESSVIKANEIKFNEDVKESIAVLTDIINNNVASIAEYRKYSNKEYSEIKPHINRLRSINHEVYFKLYESLEKNKQNLYENACNAGINIINKMKEMKNSNRPYDIVDFVLDTNIEPRIIREALQMELGNSINNEDIFMFASRFNENSELDYIADEEIDRKLKKVNTGLCDKNIDGSINYNKVSAATDEKDFYNAINYMKKNNIHMSVGTYRAILNRILNGTLDDQEKIKKKTR